MVNSNKNAIKVIVNMLYAVAAEVNKITNDSSIDDGSFKQLTKSYLGLIQVARNVEDVGINIK